MAERWTETHNSIFDCYVPGQSMPPVKDEWVLCRTDQKWTIKIRWNDIKGESIVTAIEKPRITDGCLCYTTNEAEGIVVPLQKNVRTVKVIKSVQVIEYRLLSADDKTNAVTVEYRVKPEV